MLHTDAGTAAMLLKARQKTMKYNGMDAKSTDLRGFAYPALTAFPKLGRIILISVTPHLYRVLK
jgi:hypothetical protein